MNLQPVKRPDAGIPHMLPFGDDYMKVPLQASEPCAHSHAILSRQSGAAQQAAAVRWQHMYLAVPAARCILRAP